MVDIDGWIADGMVQKVVGLHAALAHCTRLRIVWVLSREREVTPNEFAEVLGESQQNVSKHLKTLAQAGVVVGRKDGSCTLYSLRDQEAMKIVDTAVAFVDRQLRELTAQAGLRLWMWSRPVAAPRSRPSKGLTAVGSVAFVTNGHTS